jgi:hypothetical protein
MVNEQVPAAVGVPDKTPPSDKDIPDGSFPLDTEKL